MRIQNFFGSLRARSGTRQMSFGCSSNEFFRYTSGRWVFNEHLRMSERYLKFDLSALKDVIIAAFGLNPSEPITLSKVSEGGCNRVSKLPLVMETSEVATLDYLRLHGIHTPKMYAWCSAKVNNPVGAEYIIMEKLAGTPLGNKWFSMTAKEQYHIMKQIVKWETQLMALKLPAYGSLYYCKDLPTEKNIPLPERSDSEFCVGPIAHYSWWHDRRNSLNIDLGPWLSSLDIFRAVGERELAWMRTYAKPRLPYERLYRDLYEFRQVSPDVHIKNLSDYLKLVPGLEFKAGTSLNRPVMRHPDFQPNNILVSDSNEIVGLIDWQHSSILPLGFAAGIPQHFQNYGDPESEKLQEPQLDLPPDYDSLPQSEQISLRETLRKRLVHFLYAALTKRLNEEHYDAIFDRPTILRQRLFKSAGTPWEGDSVTLKADLIRSIQSWPDIISADTTERVRETRFVPPITYPEKVVQDTLDLDTRQKEADVAMEQMRRALGDVDVLGWVPNDEYDAAKEVAREMKMRMLEAAETPGELIGI